MRKLFWLIPFTLLFFACNQSAENTERLESRIDSLEKKLNHTYKPDLGEIMSLVQMHHAKLWFAGINQNWKLSEFEIDEIKEMLEIARQTETDRVEMNNIPMIYPPIDSISKAIREKNSTAFKNSFQLLTKTCNNCHLTVNFEFNVITIPSAPPVTNQDFRAQ